MKRITVMLTKYALSEKHAAGDSFPLNHHNGVKAPYNG